MGVSAVNRVYTSRGAFAASVNKQAERTGSALSVRDSADFSAIAKEAARAAESEAASSNADSDKADEKKSLAELVAEQTEKIDKLFSEKADKVNKQQLCGIKMKMRFGDTLSPAEQQFLLKNDPDAYANYQTTVSARKMMRCQLSACRTKDEVNGMRLSNALSALSAYKKAVKRGGDGSEIAGLNMALEREISAFASSGRYQKLPTAAERDKYYMELAKARKFEREKQAAKKLNAKRKKKLRVKQPGDGKRTVAQVKNSELGRKVRGAGSGSCGVCFSTFASGSYRKMDQKG